ncbi:hypothetical protein L798_05913 [Zootermopsis nevadensis]|uniref:Gustatory receptor n=1 Tax=Zootermopsis nevadensis TaxID=136037 RepID=A0A067R8R0_ZOONE|nr:hypothetical protein L798_05913 [Zootermopsis nevadensis]
MRCLKIWKRERHEMDFYCVIKPLYYVSKVTGVAQFSYIQTNLKSLNGKVLKINDLKPSGMLWTLFVFLVLASGLVSVMMWNFLYDYTNYSFNVIITDTFSILLLYGSSFSCLIIVGIVHRKDIIQILKKFSLLDTVLLRNHRQRRYKKENNFIIVELSVCVVVLFLSYGYHVSSWATGIAIIPFASKDLAHFAGTIILTQYVDVVLLLRSRFKKLNEELLLQCADSENNLCRLEVRDTYQRCNRIAFLEDFSALSPWKQDCKVECYKSSSKCKLLPPGSHRRDREVIRQFRVLHSELMDICDLVNSCYGFSILLLFAYYFTSLLSSVFYVMQKVVSLDITSETDPDVIRGLVSSSFWALVYFLKVVVTTVVCTEASAAARNTGRIVHSILLQDVSQNVITELKLFSLQLLGNSSELFTAFKFFEINLTFLYNFVGSTAMYLIILIQLK